MFKHWRRCCRVAHCRSSMVLYISTGDGVVWYASVDLYWWSSSLKMFTGDGVIGNVAVDIHWGRCELN